ncbi:MAG: VWA domain-containing protein [Gemmataceae bacterium]|nr:VWA domain-containing protein [Gemmataceae bacterium]
MAGRNDEPGWRAAAGGPARKGKQHGWQQEDPESNVRSGTRRFKMLFLIGGGCAAAGAIVWLILLLMPGKRPGFLAIAADPREGITRLDIPYDPYGWLSAQRMLKWMTEAGAKDDQVPKVLAENPLWLDDQFDEWIEKAAADSDIDPVVIYIGLHGGVNSEGQPILYTGRDAPSPVRESDRPAVQLKKILDKLDEKAAKKRKLVLLDTSRGLPDPNIGEISNDFVRAVKKHLAEDIAKRPTMTVVLAADDGERAWDSAHLGTTALAHGLLQSLSGSRAGSVGRENMSSYRADELFAAIKDDVVKWSKNNRATAQTPQVLPPLDDWRADPVRMEKYAERKFFKPRANTPDIKDYLASGSPSISTDLKDEWAAATALAGRQPAPATYTPIAWRRYRELLLRFERATLAGDQEGATVVKGILRTTREDIERGLDLKLESVDCQLPLAASLGLPTSRSLDAVAGAADLADAARQTLAAIGPSGQRPVEAHLPIMVNRYLREVLKSKEDGALATVWKPAVATRLLAERAALAARANPADFPYSERLWPLVAKTVIEGDEARRRGEDRLHGDADQVASATAQFREADRLYREALALAERIQNPLRLRDEALADLPFLARWLVEADESGGTSTAIDQANRTMRELWTDTMELSQQIDRLPVDPASLAKPAEAVRTKLALLRRLANDRTQTAATADAPTNIQTIEHLLHLAPPLIAGDDRQRLINRARTIEKTLAETVTDFAGETPRNSEKVIRRMFAIAQSLGGEWYAWTATQPELPKIEATLKASDENLFAGTPKLMSAFATHRQRQAEFTKHPDGGPTERALAELFSRLAVPFSVFPNPEPATTNARRRWKAMLEGQARRIALDHWYDEAGQPFFTGQIVPKYLSDAKKLGEILGDRETTPSDDERETARILAVKPLSLRCLDADATAIRWTTERERSLRYALQTTPYGVPGDGVLSWLSDEPDLLELNVASRQLVDLRKPLEGGGPQVAIRTGPRIEEAAAELRVARIRASGYFRGQRLAMNQTTEVKINRRPDLVVTNVKPTKPAAFALRTDRDFSPGAVSILLDYSKSMERSWGENGPEKKTAMIRVLANILKELPPTTDLKIHAFVASDETPNDPKTAIIFDHERDREDFLNALNATNGILQKLKLKPVGGNTPLLGNMRDTIDNFKRDNGGSRTLIVLTDGADTTFYDEVFTDFKEFPKAEQINDPIHAEKKSKLLELVRKEVKKFDEDGLLVQMVVFGENKDEISLAKEMFEPLTKFERVPGIVKIAENEQQLAKELAESIRPRPRLLFRNGSTVPNIPISGVPTNTTDQGPGLFSWRGTVPADAYQLNYFRTKQNVDFEPGDAFSIRLQRDARGRPFFLREIYYRDVDRTIGPDRIDNTHPDWHLAVPEFGKDSTSNNAFLVSSAALESKLATPAPGIVETGESGTLKQIKPAFAWWELTRIDKGREERFPGPIAVNNFDGRNTQGWRVVANNGSNFDGLDTSEFRLRGWVRSNDLPFFGTRALRVGRKELESGFQDTIQDVIIRASLETIPFVRQTSLNVVLPDKYLQDREKTATVPKLCLVVRVEDKAGRRFQVRVDRKLEVDVAEHRYFHDRDGNQPNPKVAAYTAVFGEVNADNLARLGEIEIGLVSVSDATADADPRNKPLNVILRNPASRLQPPEIPLPIDIPREKRTP